MIKTLAMGDSSKNPSGTSILVPSVQELAKQNLSAVPHRYIQPHHEHMHLISQQTHALQIPVIDMHNLLSAQSKTSELEKLHLACKHWGFFQARRTERDHVQRKALHEVHSDTHKH